MIYNNSQFRYCDNDYDSCNIVIDLKMCVDASHGSLEVFSGLFSLLVTLASEVLSEEKTGWIIYAENPLNDLDNDEDEEENKRLCCCK